MKNRGLFIFLISIFFSHNLWAETSVLDDTSLSKAAGGDPKESEAHKNHVLNKDRVTEEINEVRQTLRQSHGGSSANWKRSNRRRINTLLDSSAPSKDLAGERPLPEVNPAALPKVELPKPDGSGFGSGGEAVPRIGIPAPQPGK